MEEEAVRIREGCEPCDGVAYSSSDQGGIPRLAIDHSDQYDQRAFVIICGSYYLGGNSPERFRRTDTIRYLKVMLPRRYHLSPLCSARSDNSLRSNGCRLITAGRYKTCGG
jgi:hypothetical protein